jgi:hypothetical protein
LKRDLDMAPCALVFLEDHAPKRPRSASRICPTAALPESQRAPAPVGAVLCGARYTTTQKHTPGWWCHHKEFKMKETRQRFLVHRIGRLPPRRKEASFHERSEWNGVSFYEEEGPRPETTQGRF